MTELLNIFPSIRDVLGYSPAGTSSSWFPGIEKYYLYRARTAIYHLRQMLGIPSGSEILVPSYNCGAEVDALLRSGLTVSMYRIDRKGDLDVNDMLSKITGKTHAIYVTHYFGYPQEIKDVLAVCRTRGIPLIEDCALALYSTPSGIKLGSMGDVSFYSLPKTLQVSDGAVLVINNPRYTVSGWKLKSVSTYRLSRTYLKYLKERIRKSVAGGKATYATDYRANDWSSNIVRCQELDDCWQRTPFQDMPMEFYFSRELIDRSISSISRNIERSTNKDRIVERRRKNFLTYQRLLSDCNILKPLYHELPEGVCPLQYPVLVDDPKRAALELQKRSIFAIEWWGGFHRDLPWDDYPEAIFLKQHLLALPVFQGLDDGDIKRICDTVRLLGGAL